jgi:type I restriction enzyme S subunit
VKRRTVQLGEVCDFIRGVTFASHEGTDSPSGNSVACLTTSGVQKEVAWKSRRFIPVNRISNERQLLRAGDILISTANSKELVGKSCIAEHVPFKCTFGAFVTVARPNNQILPRYLAYWMSSAAFIAWSFKYSSNTTNISNLRVSELEEMELDLPDLSEQERIAGELERAERLRRTRRYALELSDTFLPAAFLQNFGDPRTNPKKLPLIELGEIVSAKPQIGTPTPCTPGGTYRCVRVGEIGSKEINLAECEAVSLSAKEFARYQVLPGDILLARAIGSEDHLGKLSVCQKLNAPLAYDSHVMRIRLDPAKLMPCFLAAFLQLPSGRAIFMRQTRRTAVQFNINSEQISALRIPIPPLPMQTRFAQLVKRHERLRSAQRESLRQAEHLFQTLLHQAFA